MPPLNDVLLVVIAGLIFFYFLYSLGVFDRWLSKKDLSKNYPPKFIQWWLRNPEGTAQIEYFGTENGVDYVQLKTQSERIPGIGLLKTCFPDSFNAISDGNGFFLTDICSDGFRRKFLDPNLNAMFKFLKEKQELGKVESMRENAEEEDEVSKISSWASKQSQKFDRMATEKELKPKKYFITKQKAKAYERKSEQDKESEETSEESS